MRAGSAVSSCRRRTASDAEAAPASAELELIFVDRASAVRAKLLDASSGRAELGFDGSIRLARNLLPLYGLALEDERPIEHGYRLDVSRRPHCARSSTSTAVGAGSVVVAGPQGSARQAAERLSMTTSRARSRRRSRTRRTASRRRARLETKRLLLELGAAELEPTSEYESWRLRADSWCVERDRCPIHKQQVRAAGPVAGL